MSNEARNPHQARMMAAAKDYFPEEEDAPVLVVPVRRRYRKFREIRQEPTRSVDDLLAEAARAFRDEDREIAESLLPVGTERWYADLTDAELDRRYDEAFQFRDWDTVTMLQDELHARVGREI